VERKIFECERLPLETSGLCGLPLAFK
jgi:hypothetical protein